jgi:hypothetical protein
MFLAAWFCHTCAEQGVHTRHRGLTLRGARRRSVRHERKAHGYSVYDWNQKDDS